MSYAPPMAAYKVTGRKSLSERVITVYQTVEADCKLTAVARAIAHPGNWTPSNLIEQARGIGYWDYKAKKVKKVKHD